MKIISKAGTMIRLVRKTFSLKFHLRSEWWGSSAFSRWSVISWVCKVSFTHYTRLGRSWGSSCLWSPSPCSSSPACSLPLNKVDQSPSLGQPPHHFLKGSLEELYWLKTFQAFLRLHHVEPAHLINCWLPLATPGEGSPSPSQVPQPTCYWKWHSWQLGNLTRLGLAVPTAIWVCLLLLFCSGFIPHLLDVGWVCDCGLNVNPSNI